VIPLGLSVAHHRAFEEQLRGTAKLRVRVRMQNLDGDTLSELTDRLADGQVNIDTTGEADRQCGLTLDDPHHTLNLDSSGPSDGALYADRMIRADWGLYVDALGEWVDVPVFTGPVVTMSRNGASVELSCLGKEHLAKGQCWRPLTLKKGMNTVHAIRTILAERAGETRFAFGTTKHRLPKDVALDRMAQPWAAARALAASLGRQLYYDGAGVCRLRTPPRTSLFTFNGELVMSDPSVTYDLSTVINTVWVKGHKPKGKDRVTAFATAPNTHPLSALRLGRNGVPRYFVELVEKDGVRSNKDAEALARSILHGKLMEGVASTFDSLPVPHLDPGDLVRLSTEDTSLTFVLRQASIPLTHSGVMSVGTTKRVSPVRSHIR